MKPDQVALAIGRGGHNIKLAGRLTGFDIDVYRETDEVTDDVSIDDFADEIDQWIIDVLKGIGCDTARAVLDIPQGELAKRTDLEEETIQEVVRILRAELDR
jgi:N utilization substance protein A